MNEATEPQLEQEVVKEFCGKCKREKVEGKCPACGRPTKYEGDEIMVAKVEEYLSTCIDEEYTLVKTDGQNSTTYENKIRVKLPKREGLANFLNVDEDTLNAWGKEHRVFLGALAKLDREQKERLVNSGLSGDYNPTIAKLILSSNHGMAEKTEQDITSKGEKLEGLAVSFKDVEKK